MPMIVDIFNISDDPIHVKDVRIGDVFHTSSNCRQLYLRVCDGIISLTDAAGEVYRHTPLEDICSPTFKDFKAGELFTLANTDRDGNLFGVWMRTHKGIVCLQHRQFLYVGGYTPDHEVTNDNFDKCVPFTGTLTFSYLPDSE